MKLLGHFFEIVMPIPDYGTFAIMNTPGVKGSSGIPLTRIEELVFNVYRITQFVNFFEKPISVK